MADDAVRSSGSRTGTMTMTKFAALAAYLATWVLVQGVARADTPTPLPAGTPQPPGLVHIVNVLDRAAAGPSKDGTTVILSRRLTKDEYLEVQRSGRGQSGCGTFTVAAGQVRIVPVITQDCPEGAPISAAIDFHDGQPPIGARFEPAIEWRISSPAEGPRLLVLKPDQPPTADGEQAPLSGEAASKLGPSTGHDWRFVASGCALALAAASVAVAIFTRRRRVG